MSDWPYFPECDERMDPDFMDKLIGLRQEFNRRMSVTSSYRTVDHEKAQGRSGKSVHTLGRAVDVAIRGKDALDLILLAPRFGMTGIGVDQKGGSRFVHLDDYEGDDTQPRPWIWSY